MKDIINFTEKTTDNSPALTYNKPDSWISVQTPTI